MGEPDSWVYFIALGKKIKIGWAMFPRERLRTLQTGNPRMLTLVRVIAGTKVDERALHKRFASLRVSGEWFRWRGELEEFIKTLPPIKSGDYRTPTANDFF